MASVVPIALGQVPLQAFMYGARTDDEQVVVRAQPMGDLHDKSLEVLEAVRLSGSLWATATAVAHGGIVPDVAGGPVVSRNLRFHPIESSPVVLPADDDGLSRVDPHEGAGSRHLVAHREVGAARRRHERAQTGPLSASTARSA